MVAIVLAGGLGNQLFQYAFIYSQHKRFNSPFFLIKNGKPIDLYRYFELDRNFFYYADKVLFDHLGFKSFFSHHLRRFFYNKLANTLIEEHIFTDFNAEPDDVLRTLKNDALYFGYYQSPKYFEQYRYKLVQKFKLKAKHVKAYNKQFGWLKTHQQVVVVHIRMTDYATSGSLDFGESLILPGSYYHDLIKQIDEPGNFYVFMSDDIETVKSEFNYLRNAHFSAESEIIDFQLMMNANVCLIANSTFSWWAAYLNARANKKVYCPKYFLGFANETERPFDIYPEDWIQVPVKLP